MGRKSLEATKVRFMLWARAAVTFLRGAWEWAHADILPAGLVGLCAPVLDADFFLWAEEVSCASTPLPSKASAMARKTTWKRLWGFTGFSVARFRPGQTETNHLRNGFLAVTSVGFARPYNRRISTRPVSQPRRPPSLE